MSTDVVVYLPSLFVHKASVCQSFSLSSRCLPTIITFSLIPSIVPSLSLSKIPGFFVFDNFSSHLRILLQLHFKVWFYVFTSINILFFKIFLRICLYVLLDLSMFFVWVVRDLRLNVLIDMTGVFNDDNFCCWSCQFRPLMPRTSNLQSKCSWLKPSLVRESYLAVFHFFFFLV